MEWQLSEGLTHSLQMDEEKSTQQTQSPASAGQDVIAGEVEGMVNPEAVSDCDGAPSPLMYFNCGSMMLGTIGCNFLRFGL